MIKKRFLILSFVLIQSLLNSACIPKPFTIAGDSMSPTLKKGDVIFVAVITGDVQRGDIVYMQQPKDTYYMVARVIGLPDEEVLLKENKVYINGQALDEPYVLPENNAARVKEGAYKVKPEHYFVLGDNRDHSLDSRFFGLVGKDLIYAKYHSTYKKAEENK